MSRAWRRVARRSSASNTPTTLSGYRSGGKFFIAPPSNPLDRAPSLRFAKTERAERAERFRESAGARGIDDRAVMSAVGVPKREPRRHAPLDDELPPMRDAVVRAA